MKKLFASFNRFNAFLFLAGIAVVLIFLSEFVCSFKPIISFENLLDGVEVESGSHIEGNVVIAFPPFATETTETSKFGATISSEASGNYYLVPMGEGNYIGLKTNQEHVFDMDKLVEESLAFYDVGDQPTTKVFIEGMVNPMGGEILRFFREYMIEAGFTEAEVDAMGTPMYIDYTSFVGVRIAFIGGIVSALLGLFLIIRKYKKLTKSEEHFTVEDQPGIDLN